MPLPTSPIREHSTPRPCMLSRASPRAAASWTTKVHERCRQAVFPHPIGIGLAGRGGVSRQLGGPGSLRCACWAHNGLFGMFRPSFWGCSGLSDGSAGAPSPVMAGRSLPVTAVCLLPSSPAAPCLLWTVERCHGPAFLIVSVCGAVDLELDAMTPGGSDRQVI